MKTSKCSWRIITCGWNMAHVYVCPLDLLMKNWFPWLQKCTYFVQTCGRSREVFLTPLPQLLLQVQRPLLKQTGSSLQKPSQGQGLIFVCTEGKLCPETCRWESQVDCREKHWTCALMGDTLIQLLIAEQMRLPSAEPDHWSIQISSAYTDW